MSLIPLDIGDKSLSTNWNGSAALLISKISEAQRLGFMSIPSGYFHDSCVDGSAM